MLRKWNRFLSLLLAIALVATTFNSNIASVRAIATEDGGSLEAPAENPAPSNDGGSSEDQGGGDDGQGSGDEGGDDYDEPYSGDNDPGEGSGGEEPGQGGEEYQPEQGQPQNPEEVIEEEDEEEVIPETPENLQEDPEAKEKEEKPEDDKKGDRGAKGGGSKGAAADATITYMAGEGGHVTSPEELVKAGEEANGSTAIADDGYTFIEWTDAEGGHVSGDSTYQPEGEYLVDGATFTANFEKEEEPEEEVTYTVIFMVDGAEYRKQTYTQGDNSLRIPERPFKQGYYFMGWKYNGEEVTDGMTVEQDMTIEGDLRQIELYNLVVEYWYTNPVTGERVAFDWARESIPYSGFDVTIESPKNISVDDDATHPIYYPEKDSVTFTTGDIPDDAEPVLIDGVLQLNLPAKDVQYHPYNVSYRFVHYLKNLAGTGYDAVLTERFEGNMGQVVTPVAAEIQGAVFESAESMVLSEDDQEIPIYYTRANYTLNYETNGGSYIPAVVRQYGTSISVTSTKPTKPGYDFEKWYLDEELTQPAGSNITLNEDTTLYAKWTGKNVRYTIIYMVENADDDNYSSHSTDNTKRALVGSTVTVRASDPKPSGLSNDFYFDHADSAEVKADGSTVIYAWYKRNVYTLKWNGEVYNTSGNRRAQNKGTASVTAKYGAIITQAFNEEFNIKKNNKYAWNFTKNNNDKFVSIETMPSTSGLTHSGNVITVYAFDFSTTNEQTLNYWLQNYSGEGIETRTLDGNTYGLYNSVKVHFNFLYDGSEFYQIIGYTKYKYDGHGYVLDKEWDTWDGLVVDFYYNALSYNLTLYDYNGTLVYSNDIVFNSDISGILSNKKPSAPVEGATWLGWFTDEGHTDSYTGTKMPNGLVLFGNWEFPSFTITFKDGDRTVGTDTCEYMEKAQSIDAGEKPGHTFGAWCTDPELTHVYDFAKPMDSNITVYARWTENDISYTVNYVDEDGTPVADSKYVISPIFKVGDIITEEAITVAGKIADEASKTITLGYENNEITFVYSPRQKEIDYTVRYVLKDNHDIEVAAPKENTVSGTFISVTECAAAVDKAYMQSHYPAYAGDDYYPVQDVITYTLANGTNEIIFEYTPYSNGQLIIHYVDMDGNPIVGKDTETISQKAGTSYTINTELSGYTYNRTTDGTNNVSTTVNIKEGTTERFVYFRKNITITANDKQQEYNGKYLRSEGVGDATVTGLMSGHSLTNIYYEGAQREGGSSPTTPFGATISGPAASNYYKITYVPGTLTVTKKTIYVEIEGQKIDEVYDGQPHTATYVIKSNSDPDIFLPEYIQYTGTASEVTQTNVGKQDLLLAGRFITKAPFDQTFTVVYTATDGYVNVTKRPATIWTESKDKVYDGTPLQSDIDDSRAYRFDNLVAGETLKVAEFPNSITNVGTEVNDITIDWANSTALLSNYDFTWERGTLEVTKAPITVTVTGETGTAHYDGSEHKVTGYTMVSSDPNLYDADANVSGPTQDEAIAKGTNVGKYPMNLDQMTFENTNGNFDVHFEFVDGKLTIVKSDTVKVIITGHKVSEDYDGNPHTAEGYDVEVVNPEGVNYPKSKISFTGTDSVTKTDAGTYPMGLKLSDFFNTDDNYTVEFEVKDGELEIKKPAITVTVKGRSDTKPYNGGEQFVTGYDIEISNPLYKESYFSGPSQDDAVAKGTTVDGSPYMMGLSEVLFTNNNENFDVTFSVTDGQLVITKKAITVDITGNTATYEYNGSEQFAEGYTFSISDRTYASDMFECLVDAKIGRKAVGKSDMGLSAGSFKNLATDNFDVTFNVTDGWVEITPIEAEYVINITGNSDEVTYTGEPQKVEGYTVEGTIPSEITLTLIGTAVASGTDVGEYKMNLTAEDFEAKSTEYANIKINVVDGELTVNPSGLTIHTGTATKAYDGTPLKSDEAYLIGLADADSATIVATGEQLLPDSSTNTYEITWDKGSIDNYTVTYDLGTLTVTPNTSEITLTAASATKPYDGTPLTDPTVTPAGIPEGLTLVAEATGTITDVGKEANKVTSYAIMSGEVDVTAFFTGIKLVDGELEVTPLTVNVGITGKHDSVKYDGTEHEVTGYELKIDSELYKEADFTFTGDAVAKGTVPDTYWMKLDKDQFRNDNPNFEVNFKIVEDGYLTIEELEDYEKFQLYLETTDVPRVYSGETYSGFSYGVTGSKPGVVSQTFGKILNFIEEIIGPSEVGASDGDGDSKKVTINGVDFFVSGLYVPTEGRNVGTYPLTIEGDLVVKDAEGNVVTSQFAVADRKEGNLIISKMPITVTSGSASRAFNNQPLVNHTVTTNKSWGIGDVVEYNVTGTITNVGRTSNMFTIIPLGDTDLGNYDITYVFGTLVITATPPSGGGDPTGGDPTGGGPVDIPDAPTPLAAAPTGAVLGATRELESNGPAVLGARRGRTDDQTNNQIRIFAILVSAAVAVSMIVAGKKKEEEE